MHDLVLLGVEVDDWPRLRLVLLQTCAHDLLGVVGAAGLLTAFDDALLEHVQRAVEVEDVLEVVLAAHLLVPDIDVVLVLGEHRGHVLLYLQATVPDILPNRKGCL